MIRLAFVAVFFFAIGAGVQEYLDAPMKLACERDKDNAARYGRQLAEILTGPATRIEAPGTVVSCRAKHTEEKA